MRTFKALMTGLAVGAVSVVMAASAFAAASITDGVVSAGTAGTDYTVAEGQMTVLIVHSDTWDNIQNGNSISGDDIYYINQFDGTTEASLLDSMGVKGGSLPMDTETENDVTTEVETTYYILLGGENVSAITAIPLVLTPTTTGEPEVNVSTIRGDANNDNNVTTADLVSVAKHIGELELITDTQLFDNSDVTDDEQITTADLVEIAQFIGEIIDSL